MTLRDCRSWANCLQIAYKQQTKNPLLPIDSRVFNAYAAYLGSSTWARTRDLRINRPAKCSARLNRTRRNTCASYVQGRIDLAPVIRTP